MMTYLAPIIEAASKLLEALNENPVAEFLLLRLLVIGITDSVVAYLMKKDEDYLRQSEDLRRAKLYR